MSPSDRPCRQAHIMRIETFDDILTDNRVITWDTTWAKELVARRSVIEVEMDREQMAGIMEHDTWDEAKLPAVDPAIPGIGAPIIWDGDEMVAPRGIIFVLLYALVLHCLQYGTTKSSGKRPYVSAMVGASYEPLIDAAITRLVEETLADFSAWEDEPWKSTRQ